MTKKSLVRIAGAGVLLLFFGTLLPAGRDPRSSSPPRTGWDIKMTITVKGEYGLEGRTRASGRYRMTFDWTGGLQWDGDDFILLQDRSELVEWTAEESAAGPGGTQILTTSDFDEIPELHVSYVLKHSGGLLVSFIIRGFDVPRSFPNDMFYLQLPASAESQERPGGLNYSLYVKTGSNAVILDDPFVSPGTQEKTFHWTWVRRAGFSEQRRGLFEMNRHEADVTVVVSPVKQ